MQHMHDMTGTGPRRTGLRARLILSILTSLLIGVTPVVAQQPAWSGTNALGTPRFDHTATLLTNGKVLVVGGLVRCTPACQATNTAELYDPATGAWSSAGTLPAALGTHAAVRLQNGKVLVISGFSPPNTLLRTAYLYDPDSGAWTPTGAPTIGRQYHTAVVLDELRTVSPETPLSEALEIIRREDINQLPALSNGRLAGMISRDQILRYLLTRAELKM
jgi:CBS domain/Kelch motif/Galactose oxidase, central domain